MIIYEIFELGFSWKFYMDQEHEVLFNDSVNDVVFEPFMEMDMW